MAIPKDISPEHILKAIEEINRNGVPARFKSTSYFLVHSDREYPPKYVISMANRHANGEFLNPSAFNTHEAVRYLERLGFQVEIKRKEGAGTSSESKHQKQMMDLEEYPPNEFDGEMHRVFEKFAALVEERLRAITEGRAELSEIYQESEDTIRYMMFHALTESGSIKPLDIYLEYPHPEVPNKNRAKLDVFIAMGENRPALAFEMKFQKKFGDSGVPKPNNTGKVFADILKLVFFRREHNGIKRYLVYIADEQMTGYLSRPSHGYGPFINLEENTGFRITKRYWAEKPGTFIRELKKITESEEFPEVTVICRFKRDVKLGNKELAIRVYEVVP